MPIDPNATVAASLGALDARAAALELAGPAFTQDPAIAGVAQVGETLTAVPGSIILGTLEGRNWLRSGTVIPGANGPSYLLAEADVGETITLRETATNGAATRSRTSVSTAAVAAGLAPQYSARLLLVAGQSNARKASNSALAAPARYTSLTDIFIWKPSVNAFVPYQAGVNSSTNGGDEPAGQGAWGTEAEFAYQARLAGDTRPIYIVKDAPDGNSMWSKWHPRIANDRFDNWEDHVAGARAWIAANTTQTIDDEEILWCQGEADADQEIHAPLYGQNLSEFLVAMRQRVSPTGFFIAERIRPLGYGEQNSVVDTPGFRRASFVREGTIAAVVADGNGTVISCDFDQGNFGQIHPPEPSTWNINSYTTQCGIRAWAARNGTYAATYGDIMDATPNPAPILAADGTAGSVVTSAAVSVSGFQRRAAVVLPAGLEMRTLNYNGSVHTDWRSDTTGLFVEPTQSFAVRAIAPAAGTTETFEFTIGGTPFTWELSAAEEGVTYRADTQAWLDALAAAGGSALSGAQRGALDDWYAAGEAQGWMAKLRGANLDLGSQTAARLGLKTLALATQTGSTPLPYVDGQGFLPTSNGQALQLAANPSAATGQDAIGLFVFIRNLSDNTAYISGAFNTANDTSVRINVRSSGTVQAQLNSTAVASISGLTGITPGLWGVQRTGANEIRFYGPAGQVLGNTANASSLPTATSYSIGVRGGTTDKETVVDGIGLVDGFTDADWAAFASATNALLAQFP